LHTSTHYTFGTWCIRAVTWRGPNPRCSLVYGVHNKRPFWLPTLHLTCFLLPCRPTSRYADRTLTQTEKGALSRLTRPLLLVRNVIYQQVPSAGTSIESVLVRRASSCEALRNGARSIALHLAVVVVVLLVRAHALQLVTALWQNGVDVDAARCVEQAVSVLTFHALFGNLFARAVIVVVPVQRSLLCPCEFVVAGLVSTTRTHRAVRKNDLRSQDMHTLLHTTT
jgi:hypothetical protein